jgi:flagellar biosynthesis/type III secretory pathway M-ring protein FliF/YscJ
MDPSSAAVLAVILNGVGLVVLFFLVRKQIRRRRKRKTEIAGRFENLRNDRGSEDAGQHDKRSNSTHDGDL